MEGWVWPAFYLVGVLACVYHLANGLWTAGITWGLWISPMAQARASRVCAAIGVLIAIMGTAAWWAAVSPGPEDVAEMRVTEDRMYEYGVESGFVGADPEKRIEVQKGDEGEVASAEAPDRNRL
jgi:succinate dehydrogenase / fumarate reductase cytochrome b subunit